VLRLSLAVLLVFAAYILAITMSSDAVDTIAQNYTEHTWIFNNGYSQDSRVLQTQMGYSGQKIALGASGSGISTRTIDSEVYSDSSMDEASLSESVDFDYKPYTPPLTQSDLRNALCAKNYAVGSVFSESYSNLRDLIKDTSVYQDQNISVYDISSEVQGTAHIGARVQKNADTVPSYIMGGTYIGYTDIRSEIVAGNTSVMTLPCP
jgi:hypothetical protein